LAPIPGALANFLKIILYIGLIGLLAALSPRTDTLPVLYIFTLNLTPFIAMILLKGEDKSTSGVLFHGLYTSINACKVSAPARPSTANDFSF